MNYASFNTSIVQAHKCKIIGWIGKFINPSEIGVIEQLCTLRDAWACGSARWVRLTPTQVKAHMEEFEERIESGESTAKVKLHLDAGQSRGGKRKASEKENAQASRKCKRTRMQLPPKSKAIISDDEEDEEDREGISE
jgi:hypothetical protein